MPAAGPSKPSNHPTDSGWAWVTCFASAVANFFVTGGLRSMGIVAVELIRFFNPNPILVQLVTAFMAMNFAIFSFIGNILGMRFTMHRIAIIGAILSVVGKLIATVAPNMPVLILGLGVVSGMGYGFMFGPSMVLVGQYFVKRRSLANGLAIAGGSLGQLTLPWFITGVINLFAFRGGMLCFVGLALQALPAMFLLRETSFYGNAPASQGADQEPQLSLEGRKSVDDEAEKDAAVIPRKLSSDPTRPRIITGRPSISLAQHRPSVISLSNLPAQNTLSISNEDIANTYNVEPDEVTPRMRRHQACRMICDTELLCNPVFIVFVLAISIGHSGFMAVCFFTPLYTNELWGSEPLNAALVSMMGIADLAGRILGGAIADLDLMPKPYLCAISFVICSVMVLMMPFFPVIGVIFPCAIMFGLLGGSYLSMLVVIIMELFGETKLPIALGLTTLFMGLFTLPVPPLLAGLSARAGSYGVALRIAGFLLIIGAALFALIIPVFRHRRCRMVPETANAAVQTTLSLSPSAPESQLPAVTVKSSLGKGYRPSSARPSIDETKSTAKTVSTEHQINGTNFRWSRINDAPESNL